MGDVEVTVVSQSEEKDFRVYKLRWGVLFTTAVLNLSCGAIWINNFPVATTVASYYGRDTKDVNWFSSMFFVGSIPFTFLASYVTNKYGLRVLLHGASVLTLLNAVIRAMATSGIFRDKDTQFYVGIFGQCFGAVANSAFLGIAPKVSHKWFSESQRGLSTTIGSMARPLGVIITQLSVPAIVKEEDDVPLNNYVWLAPCVFAQICTMLFITREDPKTPPSKSALPVNHSEKRPMWEQVKSCFSSLAFILLFFSLGGGIGLMFTFGTLTQQMLCPLGYSDTFAGIVNGMILFGGFFGSALATFIMRKSPKHIEATKLFLGLASLLLIGLMELFRLQDQNTLIIIVAFTFGIFSVGLLPLGLELGVEVTYPNEASLSGLFIFMSGQMQALLFIILIPVLAKETSDFSTSVCGTSRPYDYTVPLLIVLFVVVGCAILTTAFFETDYNRRIAETSKQNQIPPTTVETKILNGRTE